jgi:hypothetical protein
MNSLQAVRSTTLVLIIVSTMSLMYAKSTQIVSAPCENAIAQATVLAAHRKRSSLRPYPTAPVLNIESNRNFAKVYFFGTVWSHKKYGELAFDATRDDSCSVTSNGHPADVVLSDLVKIYGHSTLAVSNPLGATQGSGLARNAGTLEPVPLQERGFVTPNAAATSMPELGLSGTTRSGGGIRIVALVAGGNAELAYMHVGDVITGLNGIPVRSAPELASDLLSRAPGTKLRLGYLMQTPLGSFGKEAMFVIQ